MDNGLSQYAWYKPGNLLGTYDIKNSRVRHPWAYCPHVMLLLYFTADRSVHFDTNWFAHDAHYGLCSFLCEFEWEKSLDSKRLCPFY